MAEPTLKEKTAKGLIWGGFSNGFQQLMNLVFGIFLARLLTPADYGMVGMLTIFSQIALALQESGFTAALVNQKEIRHRDYNAVFWLSMLISVSLYLLLFFCAPLIADFYDTPQLVPLARYSFLSILLSALGIAQSAFLFKKLMVKQRSIAIIMAHTISGIVGILMAYHGFSYWGIATQNIVYIGIVTSVYWYYSSWRPTFKIDLSPIKGMIAFSGKLLLTKIFNRVNDNILTVILGRFYAANEVGYYTQAYKWSSMGGYMISGMSLSVAQPVFAEVSNDSVRQKRVFRKMITFVAFVSFPVMFGLGFVAKELICLAITDKWLPSVPLMQMLCISGAFVPLTVLCQQLLISRKKADVYMWNIILNGVVILVGCLLVSPYGINTMLQIYVSVYIGWLFLWIHFIKKEIGYSIIDFLKDICPFLVLTSVSIFLTTFVVRGISDMYASICVKILAVACLYVVGVWIFNAALLKECAGFLLKKIRKGKRKA